jgi:hypothetical protein
MSFSLGLMLDDIYVCHKAYNVYYHCLSDNYLSDREKDKVLRYSLINCQSIKEFLEKYIRSLKLIDIDNDIYISDYDKSFFITIANKDVNVYVLDLEDDIYKEYRCYESSIIWFASLFIS